MPKRKKLKQTSMVIKGSNSPIIFHMLDYQQFTGKYNMMSMTCTI